MPLRDVIIALALVGTIVLVAFIGEATGSEFFLWLPVRRRLPATPPSSPWRITMVMMIVVGVFFLSRRIATFFLTGFSIAMIVSLPIGILIYEWTPGWAHYVLMVAMGSLAVFAWSNDSLHED